MKKGCRILSVFMLVIALLVPNVLPMNHAIVAEAAVVKISEKEITLSIGQSKLLTITGTSDRVNWSSSDKSVANVQKNGKVTGIKVGKAIITATIRNKRCKCTVTVNDNVNPYIANAPFEGQLVECGDFQFVVPKNWTKKDKNESELLASTSLTPTASQGLEDMSSVDLIISETGETDIDYNLVKKAFDNYGTEEKLTSSLTKGLIDEGIITADTPIEYTDYKTSDYETPQGTAYRMDFNIKLKGITRVETVYYLFIDNYYIVLYTDGIEDMVDPDAKSVGEYIMSSLQLVG